MNPTHSKFGTYSVSKLGMKQCILEFKKEECLTQILIFRMGLKLSMNTVYYSFEMVLSVRMRI